MSARAKQCPTYLLRYFKPYLFSLRAGPKQYNALRSVLTLRGSKRKDAGGNPAPGHGAKTPSLLSLRPVQHKSWLPIVSSLGAVSGVAAFLLFF